VLNRAAPVLAVVVTVGCDRAFAGDVV